ncbi:MAG: hypothetical protein ACE5KD_03235 [Candidatus Bathyarchaeia archaeon]
MPTSSVDTFFACSLMVILIVSAMVGTAKVVQPYLNDSLNMNDVELYRSLAEYILLSPGEPSDWGQIKGVIPTVFGLASETQHPYQLDLDKVSRLNSDNIYSLTYREILGALGTKDISWNIRISSLFEVSVNLTSSQSGENETNYTFQISTSKFGFPISTSLQCYIVVDTYIDNVSSSTASNGVGLVNATLPNSLNGTTLLVVFAKARADSQMMAFNVYSFGHNSETPEPNKTFLKLSPLDHFLNVSFQHPNVEVSNAYVFTYNYCFNLSQTIVGNQTAEYSVPRLSEASPMMFVLNGNNGSTSFAEWNAYPQLPLEIGANFSDLTAKSKVVALTYVVSVNFVLYEFIMTSRGVPSYDV